MVRVVSLVPALQDEIKEFSSDNYDGMYIQSSIVADQLNNINIYTIYVPSLYLPFPPDFYNNGKMLH